MVVTIYALFKLSSVCFDAGDFPSIRWKQTAEYGYVPNAKQPDVFMAIAMDLPDQNSPYECIHPRDKTDVAERLFLGARAVAYGEDVYWTGPIVESARKQYSKIYITFKSGSWIEVRNFEGFEVNIRIKHNIGTTDKAHKKRVLIHIKNPLKYLK